MQKLKKATVEIRTAALFCMGRFDLILIVFMKKNRDP